MKVKLKTYAKINLTLNVGRPENGFHPIDSIVTTVDLYDIITASKRRDDEIRFTMRGLGEFDIKQADNNAYKAAAAFRERFGTGGFDLTVDKRIAIGGGLGGSSADVAGVLRALKKLFDVSEDVKPLADELGSDCGYLLVGGTARISGRGEKVEPAAKDLDGYAVIVYCDTGVSTKECYATFDTLCGNFDKADNDLAMKAIESGDFDTLCKNVSNGLSDAAKSLNDEIGRNLAAVKELSPSAYAVTGSGSCVYALYESRELCDWAADKLRKADMDCEVVKFVPRYKNT